MLLTVHTLPQLAVSAKLLCLLMVVICGAVPSMVRSVRLYNECTSKFVQIEKNGTVRANGISDHDDLQTLKISSQGFNMTLVIHAEAAKMYLCFTKNWKLVGKLKFQKGMCEFREDMEADGYTRYRSVVDGRHFVGFSKKGTPLRGAASRMCPRNNCKRKANNCRNKGFNFMKDDDDVNVATHNLKVAQGGAPRTRHQHGHGRVGGGRRKAS